MLHQPSKPIAPRILPPHVESALRRSNPWWEASLRPPVPKTRRHLAAQLRRRMDLALAPIIVLRGPRQIGKSTAHLQIISDLLSEGVSPQRILRVEFDAVGRLHDDDPILAIADWFEHRILGRHFIAAAEANEPAILLLDEVQNVERWAPQLKFLVDNAPVQILVTGSSSLHLAAGQDSLAGRVTTMEAGVLSLTEIAAIREFGAIEPFLPDNGLGPLRSPDFWRELRAYGVAQAPIRDQAFAAFSERGGFPLAHKRADVAWPAMADELVETVIARVLRHDLQLADVGGEFDPVLMEEVCRAVFQYAGQAPGLATLQRAVQALRGAPLNVQPVAAYLRALGETLLVRLVRPLELRLKKPKGAFKLCLADHGLRAAWLQEPVPLEPSGLRANPELTPLAGHLAEGVVGATLSTVNGLDLAWFPERNDDPEVDFVLTIGDRRVPIEVKYQARINALQDTDGLRAFLDHRLNRAEFGILVTQGEIEVALDPRIVALPLSTLLLLK